MNHRQVVVLLAVILAGALPLGHASPWSHIEMPTPARAEAVGGVSNGCIFGAQRLPATGEGYVAVRRERNRHYGHPTTLRFVERLGETVSRRTDAFMMVGDLSQPRGGLMSNMHRSHQSGLDVDVWYTLAPTARRALESYPEGRNPPSMVTADGNRVTSRWGADQRFMLEAAASAPEVDRIFINPAIKQALCRETTGNRSWLGKLRPWWGHDAHFHVRLRCPAGSADCSQQAQVPMGDGCGPQLAWWFSEEARRPAKGKARPRPETPARC